MEPDDLTTSSITKVTKEFLVVWLEQIIYHHGIYDCRVFDRVKAFELVVFRNRNPALRRYIDDLVTNVVERFNTINRIVCIIEERESGKALWRYVVQFSNTVDAPAGPHPIDIDGFGWGEIYNQLNQILFTHIESLKRRCSTLSNQREMFALEVDSKEGLVTHGWTRLDTEEPQGKMEASGEAALRLFDFDVYSVSLT